MPPPSAAAKKDAMAEVEISTDALFTVHEQTVSLFAEARVLINARWYKSGFLMVCLY